MRSIRPWEPAKWWITSRVLGSGLAANLSAGWALMDIRAIYPMKSLSKGGWMKYRMPYLLRHLDIAHPNHVWSTDISYIAMEHGFMYLYAIMDVYSRCIVGWGLYNTLDASNAIEVLERAIEEHGAPEYIERFWRIVKREYIYLNPEDNVVALRRGIAGFIDYCNNRRSHQGIGHKIPAHVYAMAA